MKKKISFLKLYFGFFGILSAVLLGFFVKECVDYVRGSKVEAAIMEVHHRRIKTGSSAKAKAGRDLHGVIWSFYGGPDHGGLEGAKEKA